MERQPLDITGDASNEISGTSWDEIGERYADRVMSIIESYAPGTKEKIELGKMIS